MYHFSRPHIYALIYDRKLFFLTYFTLYDKLLAHPCLYKWHNFAPFYGLVIFCCVYVPHLLYPFISSWTFWLVPYPHFSSVAQLCPTLCDPMDCSTPGFPVHHPLPELIQTHVYQVGDAIQPSHPLSSPSPPALNLSQLQGLFR